MQDSNIEINTTYSNLDEISNKNKFYKNIIINMLIYILYLIISIIIFSFTINIIKNDHSPLIIILSFYLAIIIINLISILIFALLIYLGYIIDDNDDNELTFNIGRTGVFFIIPQFLIRFLGFIIPIILFVFIGFYFSNIISNSILFGFIITDVLIIIFDCIITVLSYLYVCKPILDCFNKDKN
jgi:hypothetical protein